MTAQAQRTYEEQRQAQVALKAAFLSQFVPTWDLLSWDRLDQTAPGWVRAVMAIIRPWRQASADLAVRQYAETRLLATRTVMPPPTIEFVAAPAVTPFNLGRLTPPDSAPDVPKLRIDWAEFDKAAERSLLVTGPGELKRQARMGRTEEQAKRNALVTTSGSASRQVLNGGRETTLTLVRADDVAVGWARMTDGDPCAFCALLASRGFAFKTEQSAGFQAHDGCACIPVPAFSKTAAWPGQAREFQRLYYRSTKGLSGKDARNAFRRAHEAKQRDAQRTAQPLTA